MPDNAARDLAGKLIAFLETASGPPTLGVVLYSFADLGNRPRHGRAASEQRSEISHLRDCRHVQCSGLPQSHGT